MVVLKSIYFLLCHFILKHGNSLLKHGIKDYGKRNSKKKLNPRIQRFIDLYVSGTMSATEAYKACGYSESTAGRNVWQFMKKYEIRDIIDSILADSTKEVADQIKMKSQDALDTAYRIMITGDNEFARLKAAQDILDRGGLKPSDNVNMTADVTNTNINVPEQIMDDDECNRLIKQIRELRKA